jgi:hypothetical protein
MSVVCWANAYLYVKFIHDGDQWHLFVEYWTDLSDKAKIDVCAQLESMTQALRELK